MRERGTTLSCNQAKMKQQEQASLLADEILTVNVAFQVAPVPQVQKKCNQLRHSLISLHRNRPWRTILALAKPKPPQAHEPVLFVLSFEEEHASSRLSVSGSAMRCSGSSATRPAAMRSPRATCSGQSPADMSGTPGDLQRPGL